MAGALRSGVSEDQPEQHGTAKDEPERPGTANFLAALNVARNARVGFAIGFLLAGGLVLLVLRAPGGRYPVAYYVALGFVLAVGVGLLLTLVFTLGSAYRLAKSMAE